MLVIVLQFDRVLREGDGLVLDFERSLIDPDRYWLMRQAPLTIELPVLKSEKSVFVEIASVAGRKQDAVEDGFGIHRAFVPAKNFSGAMTPILTLFVRPMSLT